MISDPDPTMVLIVPARNADTDQERCFEDRHGARHRRLRGWRRALGERSTWSDEKPPVEKAVELFVYAPVGMALYVRDMLPSMMGIFVSRGKREVQSHRAPTPASAAGPARPARGEAPHRRVGRHGQGRRRRRLRRRPRRRRQRPRGGARRRRVRPRPVPRHARQRHRTRAARSATPAATPRPSRRRARHRPSSRRHRPRPPPILRTPRGIPRSRQSEALPIPDYDELSASQVVERLEGLDHDSLEAIRRYETDHRGRNTILGKIAQLS